MLVILAGILAVVGATLPFYTFPSGQELEVFDRGLFPTATLVTLLCAALALEALVQLFAPRPLASPFLNFSWEQVRLASATVCVLLVVSYLVQERAGADLGSGYVLDAIAAVTLFAGGVLTRRDELRRSPAAEEEADDAVTPLTLPARPSLDEWIEGPEIRAVLADDDATDEVEPASAEVHLLEQARIEQERIEAARIEAARIEAVRLEADRLGAERAAAARLEAERIEAARAAAEAARAEAERIAALRAAATRAKAEVAAQRSADAKAASEAERAAFAAEHARSPAGRGPEPMSVNGPEATGAGAEPAIELVVVPASQPTKEGSGRTRQPSQRRSRTAAARKTSTSTRKRSSTAASSAGGSSTTRSASTRKASATPRKRTRSRPESDGHDGDEPREHEHAQQSDPDPAQDDAGDGHPPSRRRSS